MSSLYTKPARTVPELHQKLIVMVADAYLFYLVSMHRRPIFRHQYGDISLNQPALHGFFDSYLEEKGWDVQRRCDWYGKIVDIGAMTDRNNSDFIDWGTVPTLKPRGIRWMNACFSRLGEMVNEKRGWDKATSHIETQGATDEI